MLKKLVLFVTLLSCSIAYSNLNLETGKKFYDKGEYDKALEFYQQLQDSLPNHFEINYNLGAVHFKLGHKGLAVYHFEKAALIKPYDDDLQHNLAIINQQLIDKFDASPKISIRPLFLKIESFLSFNVLAILSLLILIGCSSAIYIAKKQEKSVPKIFKWGGLTLSGFLLLWAIIQRQAIKTPPQAIIMPYEASLLTEPNDQSKLIFKLHEGTKLEILEADVYWLKLKAPDNNQGWMKKDQVLTLP